MAVSQAARLVEKIIGYTGDANTEQNLSNPAKDAEKYADPSDEQMKVLVWIFATASTPLSLLAISPASQVPRGFPPRPWVSITLWRVRRGSNVQNGVSSQAGLVVVSVIL
jgi:hypothetical protein